MASISLYSTGSRWADLRATGVKLGPGGDELAQVMRSEDGGVPCQVIEVVHDDGHEQIEHDEAAEEDEGDKVDVRHVRAARLVRVQQLAYAQCDIPDWLYYYV